MHYDIISAFIKSIRGSDANAAIYYLARMLNGGEDLKFIARRLVISASEDIGLANPNAMLLANACFQAVSAVGYPESRIMLAECTIYLANSPKSNSAYNAINAAMEFSKQTGDLAIPLHLRNAPTKLMQQLGYGQQYKYAHDYPGHFVDQEFLPEEISGTTFYFPQDNPAEQYRAKVIFYNRADSFRINRLKIYEQGITLEIHQAAESAIKEYFGEQADYVTFLFHKIHCLPFDQDYKQINSF